MPYPLQFLDSSAQSQSFGSPLPLTVGSNFMPGDLRVVFYFFEASHFGIGAPTATFVSSSYTGAGWSKVQDIAGTGDSDFHMYRTGVFVRTLTAGATDTALSMSFAGQFDRADYGLAAFTVRMPHLGQSWSAFAQNVNQLNPGSGTWSAPSVTRTGPGAKIGVWMVHGKSSAFSVPSGMTSMATYPAGSGTEYGILLARQAYTGTGATGAHTISSSAAQFTAMSLFIYENPDVAANIGTAAETDTGGLWTPTLQNSVSFLIGTAAPEIDTAGLVGTPLEGRRTSEAVTIPEGEVVASIVQWEEETTATTEVLVETSVDGGASWQPAVKNRPVARLPAGTTDVRAVLTRVTLRRNQVTDPTPRMISLRVEVTVDQSYEELCPLGVFTINDVSINDTPQGITIDIAGADLSRRVSRNKWAGTYVIANNANIGLAIQALIADRMPDAQFNVVSTTRLTPRLVLGQGQQGSDDPWQDARNLAADIGCELFFDARGVCTMREEPDPQIEQPVWEFEDIAFPTVTAISRQVADEDTYNQVVVEGESTGNTAPVRAVAQDTDPASPTYVLGPYGLHSITIRSAAVTTVEQAQQAADAMLLKSKGATEKVSITAVPQPALEPSDVVTISRGLSKIDGQFLVESLTIPLGPGEAMQITSRRQRL